MHACVGVLTCVFMCVGGQGLMLVVYSSALHTHTHSFLRQGLTEFAVLFVHCVFPSVMVLQISIVLAFHVNDRNPNSCLHVCIGSCFS